MTVIDLSQLRKPTPAEQPEHGEEIIVQTYRLPKLAEAAPRIALAGIELADGRCADLSLHADGLCLFFEAPGEQTRVMPREALLQSWARAITTTERMAPVTELDAADPVTQRLEAERAIHTADEAPITTP